MTSNYLFLCLLGITSCLVASTVAIVGGDAASLGQFPYQVGLMVSGSLIGGGGIIAERFILTAAQCLVNERDHYHNHIIVISGTNNLHHGDRPTTIEEVDRAYVLKEFRHRINPTNADIAVLKLKNPLVVTFHGNLQKVMLPRSQRDSFDGETGLIAGFGWNWIHLNSTSRVGGNIDNHLRFAGADVVDNGCLQGLVHEGNLCAKVRQRYHFEARGTCVGDTGSLLVNEDKLAFGILSLGPKDCNEHQYPAIYTRISHYLTFIRNAREGRVTKNMREIIFE